MRREWTMAFIKFWDMLAAKVMRFGIKCVCGDFNMSLTKFVPELRSRGIESACVAWYPWQHATTEHAGQPLGFDSCGIFVIGGPVQVTLDWMEADIPILTARKSVIDVVCKQSNKKTAGCVRRR